MPKNLTSTFYASESAPYSLEDYDSGVGMRRRRPPSAGHTSNYYDRAQIFSPPCEGNAYNFHKTCSCNARVAFQCACDCYLLPSLYHKLLTAPYTKLSKKKKEAKENVPISVPVRAPVPVQNAPIIIHPQQELRRTYVNFVPPPQQHFISPPQQHFIPTQQHFIPTQQKIIVPTTHQFIIPQNNSVIMPGTQTIIRSTSPQILSPQIHVNSQLVTPPQQMTHSIVKKVEFPQIIESNNKIISSVITHPEQISHIIVSPPVETSKKPRTSIMGQIERSEEMNYEHILSSNEIEEPNTMVKEDKLNDISDKLALAPSIIKSPSKLSVISKTEKKRVYEYEKQEEVTTNVESPYLEAIKEEE